MIAALLCGLLYGWLIGKAGKTKQRTETPGSQETRMSYTMLPLRWSVPTAEQPIVEPLDSGPNYGGITGGMKW